METYPNSDKHLISPYIVQYHNLISFTQYVDNRNKFHYLQVFVKSCSDDSFCYALFLHVCPDFLTFYLKLYPVLSGQGNQSQHELPPTLN